MVVGDGPAGAAAAYYLQKDGYEVTVLEKESFVGGRTHGYENEQVRFDTGASFFTNFYPLLKELVKKLDMEDEIIELERRVGLKYNEGESRKCTTTRICSKIKFWRKQNRN